MKLRRTVLMAVLCALSTTLLAQTPRRDGRWEVTMQMEMPGMPGKMPPFTTEQCVTKEQADDPQRSIPQQPQRGGGPNDCKVENYKAAGNKVTWTMRCTTPQPMSSTGEMTYTGDSYAGTMTMNMERGGQPMTMTMKMSGKRLGDCTK